MKGKALRRALAADPIRVGADAVTLIVDTTELITPDAARALLTRNHHNRPINWRKVEQYADAMRAGEWRLHGQGIMLDKNENILTGQKRLWAVVYSGVSVYFRVSRGNSPDVATLIDRGDPQTARDLAGRITERRHAPTEISIARAWSALMGNAKPNAEQLALIVAANSDILGLISTGLRRVPKRKALIMVAGALLSLETNIAEPQIGRLQSLADAFELALLPHRPEDCWNRGAAFTMGMEKAADIVARR